MAVCNRRCVLHVCVTQMARDSIYECSLMLDKHKVISNRLQRPDYAILMEVMWSRHGAMEAELNRKYDDYLDRSALPTQTVLFHRLRSLQCFDAVRWAAGRASGL